MDLNQDIGALIRELFAKMSTPRSSNAGGVIKMGRLAPALAFAIPAVGAASVPAYQYVSNLSLPGEYQRNVALYEQRASEYSALRAELDEKTLQLNVDGGLFEDQREIEQFFSFIANEVVSHRLTTSSFSQSEVVAPTIEEGSEQLFFVVNPGAKLDLSGDYRSVMAFLTAIRDLEKEIVVSELVLGHPEVPQGNADVAQSGDLDLSLSLQVFRFVSIAQ